jgi:hypothetical protein
MTEPLHHFSDREDISIFAPRAPLRHPRAEPLVYAIDGWHSPLYFFPRDCPRIGICPVESTSAEDRESYNSWTDKRMRIFVEQCDEPSWRTGELIRYDFNPLDGFIDTGDHGVWISRQNVRPLASTKIRNLPEAAIKADVEVLVTPSLLETAKQFFDFEERRFLTTLHVSMIRTSLKPDWPVPVTKPVFNSSAV